MLKKFLPVLALLACVLLPSQTEAASYTKRFIITAYYSPLPDQDHYLTGDYWSEIRLNGRGTNGASGKEVYPGMIAAPKSYAFGTKMTIPGVGTVAVYDRGGAIKKANGTTRAYDRLDIWMGRGEKGLSRALAWGKREVDVVVHGIDPNITESVHLDQLSTVKLLFNNTVFRPKLFARDVFYKSKGEDVRKLQKYLKELGFFKDEPTGFYGNKTRDAVIAYQLTYGIISSKFDFGAGHFGRNSRKTMDKLIIQKVTVPKVEDVSTEPEPFEEFSDLQEDTTLFYHPLRRGNGGDKVVQLQQELKRLGFLRLEPTGNYGSVTEHAVFKLQQSYGLVAKKTDLGAGYVGPKTRSILNSFVKKRFSSKNIIAKHRIKHNRAIALKNNKEKSVIVGLKSE